MEGLIRAGSTHLLFKWQPSFSLIACWQRHSTVRPYRSYSVLQPFLGAGTKNRRPPTSETLLGKSNDIVQVHHRFARVRTHRRSHRKPLGLGMHWLGAAEGSEKRRPCRHTSRE